MKKETKKKAISKKIISEVLKRYKFTCQDCGKKVPEVFLYIICTKPISEQNKDEALDFKTTCYECSNNQNNKQRIPTEIEKEEQKKLLLQYEEELIEFHKNTSIKLIEYIESKINNFCLTEPEKRKIEKLITNYELQKIINAINISASKYLKFDKENNLIENSIEDFINKIGGILFNQNNPSVDQTLKYIKAICQKKFDTWDDTRDSTYLDLYVNALKEYGYTDKKILDDLKNMIEPKAKEIGNLDAWRYTIESWIEDIKNWKKNEKR